MSRVISIHMGPMYIETPYIIISTVISRHMGPMYIETPYIIISTVISSPLGPMYIETPYTPAQKITFFSHIYHHIRDGMNKSKLYLWSTSPVSLVVRVFTNGSGDWGLITGRVIPKTLKMVLDATLLNHQYHKVIIKSKVQQSRERSSALPYSLVS